MPHPTKYFSIVLSSLALAACGGGGGSADGASVPVAVSSAVFTLPAIPSPGNSLASTDFVKYEGVWRQDCDDHMLRTTALVATGANVFTVTPLEKFFAYANCTGDVVATGSYGGPQETVTYGTSLNATVTLKDLTATIASVNPATSRLAVAPYTFTGSGVQLLPNQVVGSTSAYVAYADGSKLVVRNALDGGSTVGGLLSRNDELLTLVPVVGSTTSFTVNQRFFR